MEILEIKKPQREIDDEEFQRAYQYLTPVKQFLKANKEIGEKFKKVRLSLICKSVDKLSDPHKDLLESNSDVVTHRPWQTILDGAMTSYGDYIEAFEAATAINDVATAAIGNGNGAKA